MYCHKVYQMKDTWAFGPLLRDDLVERKLEFLHHLAASFEPFDPPGIERINLRPNSFLRSQEFCSSFSPRRHSFARCSGSFRAVLVTRPNWIV